MSKKRVEQFFRGWFPKEHLQNFKTTKSTPQTKAEPNGRAFKVAQIANGIMVSLFLGTNFLFIRPVYDSIEVTVLQWSIFVPILIGVNILIYRHYKQRLLPKGWF